MLSWIFISLCLVSIDGSNIFKRLSNQVTKDAQNRESDESEGRIVGGRNATCGEFPHQVSFIVNNTYFCGGSSVDPSTVVLRSGSTYRNNGTIVPIIEVTPHPEYNNPPFDKDVAVMKTAEPIKFNLCTEPIDLPPKGLTAKAGTIMTVSGWGRTEQGASTIPQQLMAVNLTIVNQLLCQVAYFSLRFTENMMCAGNFFLGGKSTCQGDSGGVGTIDGVARGIVSFGRGCGQPLSPSVFANLAGPSVRDFITKLTGL